MIRFFLDHEGRMRDRALFDFAIDSKLRGCDLFKMKIGSLVSGQEIRARSMVIQQKTGRPVQFEITADTRASLLAWLERSGGSIDDYGSKRVDPKGTSALDSTRDWSMNGLRRLDCVPRNTEHIRSAGGKAQARPRSKRRRVVAISKVGDAL